MKYFGVMPSVPNGDSAQGHPFVWPADVVKACAVDAECFVESELHTVSSVLRTAYAYWQSKWRPDRLPGRADIDPLDLRGLLPSLMLLDVLPGQCGRRFRFRLMGEYPVAVLGWNATGLDMDDIWEILQRGDGIRERFVAVCERCQAHYWQSHFIDDAQSWRCYESVVMPLASDGKAVNMLLACMMPLGRA